MRPYHLMILAMAAGLALLPPSSSATPAGDALSLYGPEILFDVQREGESVGSQQVRFSGSPDDLTVDIMFELEISVLFITAFEYRYRSTSRWRNDRMVLLDTNVDDNGTTSNLQVRPEGDALRITNADATFLAQQPLFPTNHWHAGVLTQSRVLNTLTGRLNDVSITYMGTTPVETEKGVIQANHYIYSGELDTEVWYDDHGRWVKLRFRGRDDSVIDYVCRRCQGPSDRSVSHDQ